MGWSAKLAGLIALVGLGITSWSYSQVWRESETVRRWLVELDPDCRVCHGSALGGPAGQMRSVEGEGLFHRAIALRPGLPDAYFTLGTAGDSASAYRDGGRPLSASGPERLGLVYVLDGCVQKPDALDLRHYLVKALEGQAQALRAQGRGGEAKTLLAEVRAVSAVSPKPKSLPAPQP